MSRFSIAEARALVAARAGQTDEARAILRAAARSSPSGALFDRTLYDLLAEPDPLPGLDAVLAVWREIVADTPSAAGPIGLPNA